MFRLLGILLVRSGLSRTFFHVLVLFVVANFITILAHGKTKSDYVGFYEYSIGCKDKKYKKRNEHLCRGQTFAMKSSLVFDGKTLKGDYTAKDSNGDTFYGEYYFTKFSFKKSALRAELIWKDKWGDGKLNLQTNDNWKSFTGKWWDSNGKIRGRWNAESLGSSANVAPIMQYALFVRGEENNTANDTLPPIIEAFGKTKSQTNVVIKGQVSDNVAVAEVTIDGEPVSLSNQGSFSNSFYVPRGGKTFEIVAFDAKGNMAKKSLFIERGDVQQATGPVFASLNPSGKRVGSNKDALALIIGVADYQRTRAKAAYADKDAQTFYDYAMLKLGITAGNIKELLNSKANEADVRLAVKDWIARSAKNGRSDIYVFFAGHGLASDDGEKMYLLPVDGEPRLLDDTAILRDELFADIASANPRSVTVFLDTCYSGTTRGTDMLIASRPIAIKALEQSIPDNFTVMTAARGDQTAKPLEEAKHGMFSYFLMKGMEGEADKNQDNKITAGELHQYVQSNVVQQSSGSQTPELQGDADRVLVRFQ